MGNEGDSMSQTLRDFLSAREAEIKEQIKALNDELRDVRAARCAIDPGVAASEGRPLKTRMTQREMIVSALDARPEGGASDKIVGWIKQDYGADISQATMSSQLSRAKSDGLVVLDTANKIWRSAKHFVEKNEPPEGGSEGGEGASSPRMPMPSAEGSGSAFG